MPIAQTVPEFTFDLEVPGRSKYLVKRSVKRGMTVGNHAKREILLFFVTKWEKFPIPLKMMINLPL